MGQAGCAGLGLLGLFLLGVGALSIFFFKDLNFVGTFKKIIHP
jgi:hypothetical protein